MDYLEYKNYVSHSGILGMKWGKRNGPPYPLKPGDHSAEEKRKNKGNYSQDNRPKNPNTSGKSSSSDIQKVPDDVYNEKKKMSPETKKKILIGAGITAGVIAVTGATTLGVAVAVKEPEVFSNAFNDIKSTILQKSSDEIIRNRIKGSMTDGFKEKLREDTFNSLNNKNSAQVRANQIHKDKVKRNIQEDMRSGFKDYLNGQSKSNRADIRKSMSETFSESQKNRNDQSLADMIGDARDKIEANKEKQKTKVDKKAYRDKQKEIKQTVRLGINEQKARQAKANYEKAASNVKYVWNKADKATKKASDFTNKATSPARNATQAVKNVTGTIAGVSGTVAVTKKMYDNLQAKSLGMTPQEYQQYKKYINQQR